MTTATQTRWHNEARDQEVFLYDAKEGRLACASCNPSGARPHGVLDTENAGEGLGLLVDRPEAWHRALAGGEHPRLDGDLRGRRRLRRALPVALSLRLRSPVLQRRRCARAPRTSPARN